MKSQKVFLTIDDGPTKELSPFIIETLKKYEVKASLFCVGENIQKNEQEANNFIKEGHILANHSHNHLNGWKTEFSDYVKNVEKCADELSGKGTRSKLFRPPYGRITRKQASELIGRGYQVIMWDVLSGDFDKNLSPEKCLSISIKHTSPGSIVVFHDNIKSADTLEYVLPRYLESILERGLNFGLL